MSARGYFKQRVPLLVGLRKPVSEGYGPPICQTCGRYLDSYEIVEDHGTAVKVLGKHHGAEQLVTFDLGTAKHVDWHDRVDDLAKMMRGHVWFQPELVGETAK